MEKIYIVGNPNAGKTTLFNSLTKSNGHTGNWHGVTVDAESKTIHLKNFFYEIYDLPGLYSLNVFSFEEQVSLKNIKHAEKIIYILDAFNFKRNMYLAIQLLALNKNVKICINNYHDFNRQGGKINVNKLASILGCNCEIINAKKQKATIDFFNFQTDCKLSIPSSIEDIYHLIDELVEQVLSFNPNKTYGFSKLDNKILKLYVFLPLFLLSVFFILYSTFFLIGPKLSDLFSIMINNLFGVPISFFLNKFVKVVWITRFFEEGIISSALTLSSFLPQVVLLYLSLSILEESGIISRMAFVFDDFLSKIGLNGKAVYTLLMGFGCNTSACFTSKTMADRKMKIKTALITPFMSCTAKLPVYSVIASALFGVNSIFVIFALYLLGVIVAIIMALIYEKTILKSKTDNFLIEFPPLKFPSVKSVAKSSLMSAKQFIVKVFGLVLAMSIIIWLLTNLTFNFKLTSSLEQSILYFVASKISWIFIPLGLNSPAIVSCLIVGLVAKELIISSFIMFNKVQSNAQLISSLSMLGSCVHFTKASAISFLVFVLLYSPCLSTIAVQYKELGKKFASIGLVLQNLIAYVLSMLAFSIFSGNIVSFIVIFLTLVSIFFAINYLINHLRKQSLCSACINCNRRCN